ncbi:MAG: hypothetical protein AB1547_11990 [Thermodesulfobacteriota bacterium]
MQSKSTPNLRTKPIDQLPKEINPDYYDARLKEKKIHDEEKQRQHESENTNDFQQSPSVRVDIRGYYEANKHYFGNTSLEEVAKDFFVRSGDDRKYPSYEEWKKRVGIQSIIEEDNYRRSSNRQVSQSETTPSGENWNVILWPLIAIIVVYVVVMIIKRYKESKRETKANKHFSATTIIDKIGYQKDVPGDSKSKPIPKFKLFHWKSWKSWASLISAFVIASFLNILLSGYAGVEPRKNITWTVCWIFLSIEAWKYWKWKALLPYPLYLIYFLMAAQTFRVFFSDIEQSTFLYAYSFISIAFNIGGLSIFYILLQKTHQTQNHSSGVTENRILVDEMEPSNQCH